MFAVKTRINELLGSTSRIFVNVGSVTVFAAGTNGNATPSVTISGSNTGLNGPAGVAVH
jgi:hypothetical protein